LLTEDQIVIVDGEVSMDDFSNSARIVARELYTIDQARERFAKHLRINIASAQTFDVQHFMRLLGKYTGNCSVIIRYLHENIQADIRLGKSWLIKPSDELLASINEQMGIENLEIIY